MSEKSKSALTELEIALDNWKKLVQESLRAHKKGKYHPNPYWILKEIQELEGKTQALRHELEELNSLLSKRPHSCIDEHWVGGAFHEYAKPVHPHEFELWFWEFEPKWKELLGEEK